jgi:hypothetical protein
MTPSSPLPERSLATHLASWIVVGVIVGWFVAYGALRYWGSSPNDAALPALLIGGAVGIVAAVLGVGWARRQEASGRPLGWRRYRVTDITRLSARDREVIRIVWPVLIGAAVIAGLVAIFLLVQWLEIHGTRPKSTLLMVVWDGVLAVWLLDEAFRIRTFVVEGIEALYFGCLLTAVLAGIGMSRSVLAGGQVILIVAAALAGAALGILGWRLAGARFVPISVIVALVVAGFSLVLPLVS